jgi:membrane fusion protein (multidrug efflux system)
VTTRRTVSVLVIALALAAYACSGNSGPGGGGPGRAAPAPEVGYVTVHPQNVPHTVELAGRVAASATSDVRPQVSGIIRDREFTEGSVVQAGQTLYQIDPSLYQAAVDQAEADLASAQATANATRAKADRYKNLVDTGGISEQDYVDAEAAAREASASVQQAQARLETARINLRFTTVPAPITGRIGRSLFTVGALVTSGQTDPLAVIYRLDPAFVDIQQSSSALLALRRSLEKNGGPPAHAVVHLKFQDGSGYGETGTVEFAEAVVDESTSTVTLRARFPNPDGLLLPGMFVRASFVESIDKNAYLVPQPGVSRDAKGSATVLLAGPDGKVVQRQVTADRTQGTDWVVTSGLEPGDRVITEGTGKVRPGQSVRPVPAGAPQPQGNTESRNGADGGSGSKNEESHHTRSGAQAG